MPPPRRISCTLREEKSEAIDELNDEPIPPRRLRVCECDRDRELDRELAPALYARRAFAARLQFAHLHCPLQVQPCVPPARGILF